VVERADDAAAEEDVVAKRTAGVAGLEDAEADEEEGDATVAKTSKKPSTQRWTTHQRQYSTEARLALLAVHQAGAVEEGDRERWR
jgi:hypothetical protein